MLQEISQVLRLIQMMAGQKKGGLLLMLWTEPSTPSQLINWTVAAAGLWCAQIEMKAFHYALTDLKVSLFSTFSSCPEPEELRAFTQLYGPLKFKLSFQMKDMRHLFLEWRANMEAFLRSFSLVNAEINIHLTLKLDQHTAQYAFGAKVKRTLTLFSPVPLKLDVTCRTEPSIYGKERCGCLGGHPVCGSRLHVSIPPHTMDQGLFGDLSIQFVTLLSPCVLQYPNLATHISSIQLMVFNPSRVPVLKVPRFLQTLPASLDFEDLGVDPLHCSYKDVQQQYGASTYTSEVHSCSDPRGETSVVWQRVLVLIFLQLSDPFTSHLTDVMATEMLLEHHLEDILNNNRHAVTAALQSELRNTLKAHNSRKKIKEKLHSAAEVILSSSISIVSGSSNLDFRRACLNRMKVHDTHKLSAAFGESLRRVTSWKCIPRHCCFSAKMKEPSEGDELIRAEMEILKEAWQSHTHFLTFCKKVDMVMVPFMLTSSIQSRSRQSDPYSRVNLLQQHWIELRDREHRAHQYNQQLLHQFAEAQHTLKELQARNAEMKMIRTEYERYLQENGPRWQQQFQEKTQTAQREMMATYSNPYPKDAGEEMITAPVQGFSKRHSDNDYVSSLHQLTLSSWLTNNQSHSADLTSNLQPNHPQHPYSISNPNILWTSDPHWCRISMSPSKKLSQVMEEEDEDESNRGGSSEQQRSSSLEMDVHPVRLSSNHSSMTSTDVNERSRKRTTQKTTSDGEKSSTCSPPAVEQSSESDASSGKCHISRRTRRSGELSATRHQSEKTRNNWNIEETEREEVENLVNDGEKCGSVNYSENTSLDMSEEDELTDQEQEKDEDESKQTTVANRVVVDDDDEISSKNITSDEEEEIGPEDEKIQNELKTKDHVDGKQISVSSGEEEEEEEEEVSKEEEEAGEDSEDRIIIISAQDRRSEAIPVESEEKSEAEPDNEDSDASSDEDIENLLAPQQRQETELKSEENSKDVCHLVQVFKTQDMQQTDHLSDSDEFDHFDE